ncbi:hypothetical protein [Candidatus Poriferisocius sp.]|uniref:hypothetical protein n=1 Tax=Candidatus Poriferisocius sp. TaxID=3101276 RepID=UPI003B02BC18
MNESQVEANYAAYQAEHKERLERDHQGKTALMHDGKVIDILEDQGTAYQTGLDRFGLGNFSLIVVGEKPVHMGVLTVNLG